MKLEFGLFFSLSRLGKNKSCPGLLARLLPDEVGSTLVYMTLTVPVLIGIAGLGTEGGLWLYKHRVVQSAADNAAYSAATAYALSKTSDLAAQARAITANDYNLVDGVNGVTVSVHKPPAGGCYRPTSNYTGASAIEVIVTQPQTPLFSMIWLSNNVNICGRAIAIVSTGGDCVLALAPAGSGISVTSNNVNVNLAECSFFSNSSAANSILMNGNNDSMIAESIGAVGGTSLIGNQKTSMDATTGNPKVDDPYASDAASWPTSGGTAQTVACDPKLSSCTLSPGLYAGGITLSNTIASYTMSPGIYYLSGDFTLSGNHTTVTGNGVTIVLTGNSVVNVTGNNSSMTLTAPTTGWNAGIAIWEPTSTGNNVVGSNSFTVNVTGVIYTPNATVAYNGNTAGTANCTQIIAQTISFGGNSINFTGDCGGVPGVKTFGQIAALVE